MVSHENEKNKCFREYLMYNRVQGFLVFVWFGSSPPLFLPRPSASCPSFPVFLGVAHWYIQYRLDEGVEGSGLGLFLIGGHLLKIAARLKRSQLNVCTVYVYCVRCTLFPPVAETCARLASNLCQYLTTVTSGANSLFWVTVCYLTAS